MSIVDRSCIRDCIFQHDMNYYVIIINLDFYDKEKFIRKLY